MKNSNRTPKNILPKKDVSASKQRTPRESKPFVECQYPMGTAVVRASIAEALSHDYQSVQCSEHGLYHSWIAPTSYTTHNDIRRKVDAVRTEGYRKLPNGKWMHSDKKASSENK